MKRIYLTTFYLFLGVLSLGMPQVYSTSQEALRKDISRKYFHVFQTAMEVYRNDDLSEKAYHHKALKEIKSYIEISPKSYECIALCYIYYHFDKVHNNIFPTQLLSLISGFIKGKEDNNEDYYQQRRKRIIRWGFDYCYYTFCAECLASEAMYIRLCNLAGTPPVDVLANEAHYDTTIFSATKYYMYEFYIHKENFLKHDILLWLIKERDWPVPTNKKIDRFNIKERKKLRYIQLLAKGE